jgi:hypothetical protein
VNSEQKQKKIIPYGSIASRGRVNRKEQMRWTEKGSQLTAHSSLLTVFMVVLQFMAAGQSRADDLVFQSQCCTIHYSQASQLESFAGKIRAGAVNRTLNQVVLGKGGSSGQAGLGEAVDALFKRVQLILDMPMPKLRVEIQIHRDEKEVARVFTQITGESSNAPSFYWKRTNTIHTQPESLTVGMLAHEMGHCIIDHYFAILPPTKIAEMLCQYVDTEVSGTSERGGRLSVSHFR